MVAPVAHHQSPSTSERQHIDELMQTMTEESRIIRAQTSKIVRKRIILEARDMTIGDIRDPMTTVADRSGAVRSLILIDQQLAVLLGESKPPTISVSQSLGSVKSKKMKTAIDVQAVARLMESE